MLRKRLDKVPWDRFFLIANGPLTMRPYPDPDTCSRVWVILVGAMLALVFPLSVWKNDRIGAHPALECVLFFALAATALLLVLAVLMSIRSLRNRPSLSYISIQYAVGCLRMNMWVMNVYLAALVLSDTLFVDNEQQFIGVFVACYAMVFILSEAIWNVFIFRRTVSRIEQNKYRSNGPGFWDGEGAWKVLYVLIAVVMVSAAPLCSFRIFRRAAGIYLGMNYGITDINGLEVFQKMEFWITALWNMITAMTCVLTTFANARMWIVLYCFRRFGSKYDAPSEEK